MSTSGLLSRLGFRQGLRSLTTTNARRSVPLLVSRGLKESVGARSPQGVLKYGSSAAQGLLQPRFYSDFLKSKGEMKIAVIGQSMFGQEVRALVDGPEKQIH